MHFKCIRNVSDLFVNLKELCSERGVLIHQIITFLQGDSLLLQGGGLLTVIFRESANNIDLLLHIHTKNQKRSLILPTP